MKLILEKLDGEFYVYIEDEEHFKNVEPMRARLNKGKSLNPKILEDECNLEINKKIPKDKNWYMIFNLKDR